MLVETKVDDSFIAEQRSYTVLAKGIPLFKQCSDSVVLFATHMCGITLRAWQIALLRKAQDMLLRKSDIRSLLALTSRQVGKTTADAILADWVTIFNKAPSGLGNHSPVGLVSASEDQSTKLLREMRKIMILGDKYLEKTYKNPDGTPLFGKGLLMSLIDDKAENNTSTITFKAYDKSKHGEYFLKDSLLGSFIKSYPPTAVILGNTFAFLIVDEAGKTDRIKDEAFKDYMLPTLDEYRAPMLMTSTAWEPNGYFFEKCDVDGKINDTNTEVLMFTIDAIKIESPERYNRTYQEIQKLNAKGDTATVQRQYYCRFVKSEKLYFDPEKIYEMFDSSLAHVETSLLECDMGIDFGGKQVSRTVINISYYDEEKDTIVRLYHKRYPLNGDDSLLEDVEDLLKRFKIQRIVPDDCPAGWAIIRQMINKGWNVTPMNFKTDKVKKYGSFRGKLNQGKIKSYKDDELKVEMRSMENTEGGKQSYIMAAPGYTDDMIDAFVMSAYHYLDEHKKVSFHYWKVEDDTVHD